MPNLPDHCKDVSLRHVDFPLTRENILSSFQGKVAYTRTDFMVLRNGEDTATVRVIKRGGKDLFRPIIDLEILSLPEDTVFIHDEGIDVLNMSQLARLVRENGGRTVVVSGMFSHVSFLKAERLLDLRVLDVVPPSPSKLSVLVERALSSGLVERPIIPSYVDVDIMEKERMVRTPGVIFPCRASGLSSEKRMFYLDETPTIDVESTLIGCDLSRRIFQHIYRRPIESLDICPQNLAPRDGVPTIVKCCKVKEGCVIEGSVASVPWGATMMDVVQALQALFP
ncbi:MAG: hypothetical protein KBH31_01770 [Methanomassiliicoccales archaeon]|nr:hypothetical protein [Methanomassiliicoccales archaeon]HRU11662.1 hypothetical protein [Methanomassiliicoccales archaeon]